MSVTSFNDAVVAAVAKGFLDAAAEVETVKDDLRKTAKVVQVRRLEGGGRREGGFFGRPILRVRGRREVHDGVARERGEKRRDERGEQTFVQVSERFSSIERGRGRGERGGNRGRETGVNEGVREETMLQELL